MRTVGDDPMGVAAIGRRTRRPGPNRPGPREGFSLLEMMMVVTLILIIASIATPMKALSSQLSALSSQLSAISLQRAC
jgi:prepilin-type N-terminal cleavage/methylation domain-containing protein